jgi:hypothetical protein
VIHTVQKIYITRISLNTHRESEKVIPQVSAQLKLNKATGILLNECTGDIKES